MIKNLSFYSATFGFRVNVCPRDSVSWLVCDIAAQGLTLDAIQFKGHEGTYPTLRLVFEKETARAMFLIARELTAMHHMPSVFVKHSWDMAIIRVEFVVRYPTITFLAALMGSAEPEGPWAIAAGRYGIIVAFETSVPWGEMLTFLNLAREAGCFLCRIEEPGPRKAWQYVLDRVFQLPSGTL